MTAHSACASCGSPTIEITFHREQAVVTLHSCSACDTRRWVQGGHEIDRGAALPVVVAAVPPGARRG